MANPLHFQALFRILYDIVDQNTAAEDWQRDAALRAFVVLDIWGNETNQAIAALHLNTEEAPNIRSVHEMYKAMSKYPAEDYGTMVKGRTMFTSNHTHDNDIWDVLRVAASKYDCHKHGSAMYTLLHTLPQVLRYVTPKAVQAILLTIETYCYSAPFQSAADIERGYTKQMSGEHENPTIALQNYAIYLHSILLPDDAPNFNNRINAGIANHVLQTLRQSSSKYASMTLSNLRRFTGNFSPSELGNYIKHHCVGKHNLGLKGVYSSDVSVASNFMSMPSSQSISAAFNNATQPGEIHDHLQLFGDTRNISSMFFIAHTYFRTGKLLSPQQLLTNSDFTEYLNRWQSLEKK